MSSRRSRSRQTSSSRNITDDQINDLVSKLQQLLPEIRDNRRSDKVIPSFLYTTLHSSPHIYHIEIVTETT